MPTKKISDLPKSVHCRDREHNPPSMMVFAPGVYEHTCPTCGHKTTFTVQRPVWAKSEKHDSGCSLSATPWIRSNFYKMF